MKHSLDEIHAMSELIRIDLIELLVTLGKNQKEAEVLSREITNINITWIKEILDMPHGGTLSPNEIAEILLNQYDKKKIKMKLSNKELSKYDERINEVEDCLFGSTCND